LTSKQRLCQHFRQLQPSSTHRQDVAACREEFVKALQLDRQLTATAKFGSTESPSFSMCASVALAAALPFVGFGFLDNFIMVCSISAAQHSRLQQLTISARVCQASM